MRAFYHCSAKKSKLSLPVLPDLLSSLLFFSRAATAPGKDRKQEAKIQLISVDTGGRLVQPLSSAVRLGNYQPLTFHQFRDLDGSWQRNCLKAAQALLLASLSEGVLGAAAVVKSSAG